MSFMPAPFSGPLRRTAAAPLTSVLDGDGNPTLLLNREPGNPPRPDLAAFGDELPKGCDVLVVDVLASAQRVGLLLGLRCAGGVVAIVVLSFRARRGS